MEVFIMRKKSVTMYSNDVNWTYCGDHFATHIDIKSSCCTPETNTMLGQLYINKKYFKSLKKKLKRKKVRKTHI